MVLAWISYGIQFTVKKEVDLLGLKYSFVHDKYLINMLFHYPEWFMEAPLPVVIENLKMAENLVFHAITQTDGKIDLPVVIFLDNPP